MVHIGFRAVPRCIPLCVVAVKFWVLFYGGLKFWFFFYGWGYLLPEVIRHSYRRNLSQIFGGICF